MHRLALSLSWVEEECILEMIQERVTASLQETPETLTLAPCPTTDFLSVCTVCMVCTFKAQVNWQLHVCISSRAPHTSA
jgi:hypothetical protein